VATPSAALNNLTLAQLQAIWNGTDTNWDQVCDGSTCGAKAPIVVYSAQEGSGTQSTWKTFLGFDPSASTNPVNCYTPTGGSQTCVGPANILENEDVQMTPAFFTGSQSAFVGTKNPDWGGKKATAAQIKTDAIFFFSAGKYFEQCKHPATGTNCGGSPLNGNKNAIGEINGVTPNQTTILDGQFPDDRYLYNAYSNGSNANVPAATAATLNYVSEIGFMCNPNKNLSTSVVDPNTGFSYISEVQSVIKTAGFFPLSAGASSGTINTTPIDEGTVPNPAANLMNLTSGGTGGGLYGYPQYKPFDTFNTTGPNSDPSGYCLSTTTDGNTGT
jgi:hypothetical protein